MMVSRLVSFKSQLSLFNAHLPYPIMLLIIPIVILYALKLLELKFMENVSWWWINGFAFAAFIWFEFLERMLGLDKRKDEMHHKKMHEARMKRNFKDGKKK